MDIDLSEYVAGGYFITKYIDKNFGYTTSDLLPPRIISLASCIGKRLEIMWAWQQDVKAYQREAVELGIAEDKFVAFQEWGAQVNADPSYGIYDLNDALYAAKEFFTPESNVLVIGMALNQELVDDFLTYRTIFDHPDADRFGKVSLESHPIKDRIPLKPGGNPLGFEVISNYLGMLSHSWLCSELEKDMNELFNIHPNEHGLINSYDEAKKVYEWIAEDELRGTRAEPEPYHPWLLVQYALT